MPRSTAVALRICTRCPRAQIQPPRLPTRSQQPPHLQHRRWLTAFPSTPASTAAKVSNGPASDNGTATSNSSSKAKEDEDEDEDEGAMARRLTQLSEESLETGGRSARKAVEEAGFSAELRQALEGKIAAATFRHEHGRAFAEVEMPSSAGRGTRDMAAAAPWTGTESVTDASLRMLSDAHKPLRGTPRVSSSSPVAGPPKSVDTGRSRARASAGARLANARDKTSIYSSLKDSEMTDKEREQRFRELKERFAPHARAVPATIQGLASLANERIEDAIARGQFRNLPRGQRIERDYNAGSPFLDTTEYFMNKIIQKQDIVPPWIEKQQELVGTATKFRARLRNDWKRHAARMVASKGGSLHEQMQRAEAYAAAELLANPPKAKEETIHPGDDAGHISQISLSGELSVPSASAFAPSPTSEPPAQITVAEAPLPDSSTADPSLTPQAAMEAAIPSPPSSIPTTTPPAPHPFRDPTWESSEHAYHTLTINHLNSLTRSYNLQAPDLAKKPYFNLTRELKACYADVAPQLASAIRERAATPRRNEDVLGFRPAEAMERFTGEAARVKDERRERRYGFREFWRDVWRREG